MRVESLTSDVLNLILELRDCADVAAVRALLAAKTAALKEHFTGVAKFALSPESRAQVRYVLARLTAFAQTGVGRPDELREYLDTGGWDVEHIVPNHPDVFQRANPGVDEKQFPVWRNKLGALLLLPKLQNSSIGDTPYPQRIDYYRDQHLLAASLHPATRQHNKAVQKFVRQYGLDRLLQPIPQEFGVEAIKLRQELYQRLCQIVWDPARLGLASENGPQPPATPGPPRVLQPPVRKAMVTTPNTEAVRRMVREGVLTAHEQITGSVDDIPYEAEVLPDGTVQLLGEVYPDITAAANFIREKATRGWDFWKVQRNGSWVSLARLRRGGARS
jgi:hypothetical protein